MTLIEPCSSAMRGKALPYSGVLLLLLLATGAATAAPACEQANSVADRAVAAGDCLQLGPGATVTGTLTVEGRLVAAGSADAPVVVTGLIQLRGEPSTIEHAIFRDGGSVEILGAARKADATISDSTFAIPDGRSGIRITDAARVDVARSAFSGAGTAIHAVFDGHGSSLAISDSTFAGPGIAVDATFGEQGGERLALTGNTFSGVARDVESFGSELGLVALRGNSAETGRPAIVTLSSNTFEHGTVGLSVGTSNYRLLSTGDTFRGNTAAVLIGTRGKNALFDRSSFEDNTRFDMVLPSMGEATVKDPVRFDPAKVYVTESAQVTLKAGKSTTQITYDWMVENKLATASAVASVGIVGFSLTAFGRALLTSFLFVPLYARLSPEEVLNHEKRQEILEFVRLNPGVHLRRIGHALSISYGTLTYHLYRLEREGYITFSQEGLFKRYYSSAGRMKEAAKEKPMPTALRDLERQIYDTILANPGSAQSHIAQRLGLSRQALHYHIKKLEKSGFITKVPSGRETLIYATQAPAATGDPAPADT